MEQALPKVLGILGGLGPMATVYFYEMLTRHTQAARDQDHIDVIINSRATTPDRTSYILGQSAENPFDIMAADAARLVTFGADVIAIPCNTAHYFYDRLNETIPIPILNMVEGHRAGREGGRQRPCGHPGHHRHGAHPHLPAHVRKARPALRRAGRRRAGCRDGYYLRRHQAGPARKYGRV